MIEKLHDQIRSTYKSAIGKHRSEVVTPALLLDLDVAKRNIEFMTGRMGPMPAELRPHIKGQKCLELVKLQIEAGAIGVCTATVWEAVHMSRGGVEDVLIANEVGGREKIRALAEAAKTGRLSVAVDNVQNAEDLSDAARSAGSEIGVLIDVDVGLNRGGVRSVKAGVELAQNVEKLSNLRLLGLMGYEGHCMLEPDRDVRIAKAREALDYLGEVIDGLGKAGLACDIVSAGGTGTYDITGADPRITEIQAGSYVFMDNFHGNLVPGFSRSLTVLSTIIMKHSNTLVMDAGRKSVGIDFILPTMKEYPDYEARAFHEEHALFDVDDRCTLEYGDTVEFIPGYAPTTVNLNDAFHVVEGNVVVDIWPIVPRGPSHLGILDG
jgi:D-serine deaminase-like pyridoxal phosphate-dependent protein